MMCPMCPISRVFLDTDRCEANSTGPKTVRPVRGGSERGIPKRHACFILARYCTQASYIYPRRRTLEADCEAAWPLELTDRFAAVVVVNYLCRDLLPRLPQHLEPGTGVLIYEHWSAGNERFAAPKDPEILEKRTLRDGDCIARAVPSQELNHSWIQILPRAGCPRNEKATGTTKTYSIGKPESRNQISDFWRTLAKLCGWIS